jgi:ATP-binding cassette subfamily B protein
MRALDKLLHLSLRRYFTKEPNIYADQLAETSKVASFYSGQAIMAAFDIPFIVIYLSLIALIAGWLVFVPIIVLGLFVATLIPFAEWIKHRIHAHHVADDRRFAFLTEVITGIHTVKSMNLEAQMQRRHDRLLEKTVTYTEALARANGIANALGGLFTQVMTIAIIFVGSILVINGNMTGGVLAASMMLGIRALQPVRQALSAWLRYQGYVDGNERINNMISLPRGDAPDDAPLLQPIEKGIELRDIYFHPDPNQGPVFKNLSLSIPAKSAISILGDSGSGKSSLMMIMNGLLQPDRGQVLVDGQSIADFNPDSIHKEVALLTQNAVLFSGTIIDNMTMFNPEFNDRAIALAELLGLDKAVAGMVLGYETIIGENLSESIPSSVRQMISIVRALVSQPSVILFDEPNINLDHEANELLKNYLQSQVGKVTLIIITPRPSIASIANNTYWLQGGKLHSREDSGEISGLRLMPFLPTGNRPSPVVRPLQHVIDETIVVHNDLSRCLLPLLEQLNWSSNAKSLYEALPYLKAELDITDFNSIMLNLGFSSQHLEAYLPDLHDQLTPCLFVEKGADYSCLLLERKGDQCKLFDPKTGELHWITIPIVSGDVFFFKALTETAPKKDPKNSNWFATTLWRFRYHLMLVMMLTFLTTGLALVAPFFVRSVYDTIIPSGDMQFAFFLTLGATITLVLDWQLQLVKSRVMAYMAGRSEYMMGTSVFDRIISLPLPFIESTSIKKQVLRIKGLEGLREFFLGPLSILAFELPATIILITALAILNPWSIVVIGVAVLLFWLLAYLTQHLREIHISQSSSESAVRWEYASEVLTQMQHARMAAARNAILNRFEKISSKAILKQYYDNKTHSIINTVSTFLGTLTGLVVLGLSAYLVMLGTITIGSMIATQMIIWRLTTPIQQTFTSATAFARMRSTVAQVTQLMKMQTEEESGVKQSIRSNMNGEINFNRVAFRYANQSDAVLVGLSLKVEPKQMVGIIGSNGAGKSTLLKMIVRLYTPQSGTIRLDKVDSRQIKISDLRTRISYMPSRCQVFYGTIAQNLRIVHPTASQEELVWALNMAGLYEDVLAMPNALDTRISYASAAQLPNGFLQRLSLARTMLRPAPIVVMDDPGSGMDNVGDEALLHCLTWLKRRSTVVLTSFRPSHLRLCDAVAVLQDGAISMMGPYDQVAKASNMGAPMSCLR